MCYNAVTHIKEHCTLKGERMEPVRIGINNVAVGREKFELMLREHFTEAQVNRIMLAYHLTKYAHRGQARDDGSRYFDHLKAVALIFMVELKLFDEELLIISLLHDILEDSLMLRAADIAHIFGPTIAGGVVSLTKQKGEDYFAKLHNASFKSKLVKLADRVHNLREVLHSPWKKRTKYVHETEDFYFDFSDLVSKESPQEFLQSVSYLRQEIRFACDRAKASL